MNIQTRVAILCLLGIVSSLVSAADTPSEATARALHRTQSDAVVIVRATVTVTVTPGDQPAQTRDRTFEQLGTVVSKEGRVVLSATSLDPAAVMDGRTVNTPAGPMKISATSQVKEAFIVLADGTEIPAKVLLSDKDLNLAVIAPVSAVATPFVAIDTTASAIVEPVDEVVVLGRMEKSFNRCAKVEIDSVVAVVSKPRPLISIHISAPGCPVFSATGKFVGLTSAKVVSGGDSDGEGMSVGMEPVVIPAESIQKFLAQAKPATK